jgi:hypothetical protein
MHARSSVRHLWGILALALVAGAAGCASSTGGGAPDGGPADASGAVDAFVPDATPDAEPCIPDPDGETCNGSDDDCDNRTDEGFVGVGDACEVGIGACLNAGTTICNPEGTGTVCDAVEGTPTAELCDTDVDEDCDTFVDEGFDDLGDICVEGVGACVQSGVMVCSDDRTTTECNAIPGNEMGELCNGADDDCDGETDEGFELGQACDGANDADLCAEGVWVCDGAGGRSCTDASGTTADLCGGGDEDCDPASADGSEDPAVGSLCDGGDSDLCLEGVRACQDGALVCSDTTGSTADVCDGEDNDCDPASPDGSEDGMVGSACDGADSDLCVEGIRSCVGGGLQCSDTTGSTVDVCDGQDNDCDPASADGSEDALVGTLCDGTDTDLCNEGVRSCSGGGLVCSDATGSTVDVCNGMDDDCDASSVDGAEDPLNGASCDGADSDLCLEGSQSCSGGGLVCSDNTGSTVDLCNGTNDDCDPASADGSEDPAVGQACDGGDGDFCTEGTNSCVGGGLSCSDGTGTTSEVCAGNNVDEDCDGTVDDGFVMNDNPGCSPVSMGTVRGDTGSDYLVRTGYNEEFFYFRMNEDSSSSVYLSATVRLTSPPGADFDLYVRCFNCDGGLQSSTTGGLTGHVDEVLMRTDDDLITTESHDIVVEVRYWNASYCGSWTLEVFGNTSVTNVTCDL